jgi:hypothetical protein
MRVTTLALVAGLGLTAITTAATAAPAIPNVSASEEPNIVQVAGGCGRGFHPNPWGRCVPNRYGYYRPGPYWGAPYYGRWHSPSDYVARDLNRRELGRYGY